MLTRARTKAQAQAQLSADVSVSISANLTTLHIRYGLDDLKPPKLPLHLESLIIERDLPDLPDLHVRTLLTQLISLHAIATVRIEGYMLLFGPNASASASASADMDALRQDKRLMRQLMRKPSLQTLALSVMGDDMGRMVDELLRTARGGQPMCRCPPVMELRFCKERDFDGDRTWLKRVDISTMTGMATATTDAAAMSVMAATAIRPSLDLTLGSVMCADSDVWQPLQQPLPQLDLTLEDCLLLIGHVGHDGHAGHAGHDGVLEYLASIPEGKLHLRNVWVQLGPRAHIEGAAAAADGAARAYWDLLEKVLVNGSVG
jgi:hypothetical protein